VVLNRAAGFTRAVMCVNCLAAHLDASREDMLRTFVSYIKSRSCLWAQWRQGCPCDQLGSRACCPGAPGG